MKSLSTYINERFTVAGTTSSKLLVFDVDDTLIQSPAKVYVKKDGKVVRSLTSAEFNDDVLGGGESYDFKDFESKKILYKSTFTKYWDTLCREYKKGTHISILSARADKDMIYNFFYKNGIDIKPALIFCISSDDFPFKGTVQQRKAKTINYLSKLGYKTLVFFDDNKDNLKEAQSLAKRSHIKVITVEV